MEPKARVVTWEAPAHHHVEKNGDWFWIFWIVSITASAVAFLFDDFLLALLILIAAGVMSMLANREPEIISFAVSTRGIRVGDKLYPYSTLDAYYLDEDSPRGPELLVRSKKLFMHMIMIPIPPEYTEEIEDILEPRLPSEHLEEPLASRILEIFGF